MIALLPELSLSSELLEAWNEALGDCPPPDDSRLKWLLVGSGDVADEDRPVNRCVLFDRVTGEIVLTQDKIYPFTLTEKQLGEWRISEFLGKAATEEDIRSGRRVVVVESRLGRVVVLVCEDLARLSISALRCGATGSRTCSPRSSRRRRSCIIGNT
jgi:predicted amidohydrolase